MPLRLCGLLSRFFFNPGPNTEAPREETTELSGLVPESYANDDFEETDKDDIGGDCGGRGTFAGSIDPAEDGDGMTAPVARL